MSIVPPAVVALLGAAVVVRVVNRQPPLWERLISGLKFYGTPYESDVERILDAGMTGAVAPHASLATASLSQLICEAIVLRSRGITYSYFPIQTFMWDRMAASNFANATCLTFVYAAVALVLVSGMECFTDAPRGLQSDAVTLVAILVMVASLASQLVRLGASHLETLLSLGSGALISLTYLAAAAVQGAELGTSPLRLFSDVIRWDGALHGALPPVSLLLSSAVVFALGTLTFLPALRAARCVVDARRCSGGGNGLPAATAGKLLTPLQLVLGYVYLLAPLLLLALWSPLLLGDAAPPRMLEGLLLGALGAVAPPSAPSPSAGSNAEFVSASAGPAAGLAAPWLCIRLALSAATCAAQLLAVRANLQSFLAAAGARMAEYLESVCCTARRLYLQAGGADAASGAPAPVAARGSSAPTPSADGGAAGVQHKLTKEGFDLVMGNLAGYSARQQVGVSLAALQLVALPGLLLGLLALYVRQGEVETGVCPAVHTALASILGIDAQALVRRSDPGALPERLVLLRTALRSVFPTTGDLFSGADLRAFLGSLIWALALSSALVGLGGVLWWEVVGPMLAASGSRPVSATRPAPATAGSGAAAAGPAVGAAAASAGRAATS